MCSSLTCNTWTFKYVAYITENTCSFPWPPQVFKVLLELLLSPYTFDRTPSLKLQPLNNQLWLEKLLFWFHPSVHFAVFKNSLRVTEFSAHCIELTTMEKSEVRYAKEKHTPQLQEFSITPKAAAKHQETGKRWQKNHNWYVALALACCFSLFSLATNQVFTMNNSDQVYLFKW